MTDRVPAAACRLDVSCLRSLLSTKALHDNLRTIWIRSTRHDALDG